MWRLKVPFHPTHRAFPWTGVLWLGAASQFWPVWDAAFTWIQRILLFHLLCYKNNTNWNNYDTCPNEPTVLVRLVLLKTINRLHPGIYSKRRRQQMLSPPTKRANSVNCDTAHCFRQVQLVLPLPCFFIFSCQKPGSISEAGIWRLQKQTSNQESDTQPMETQLQTRFKLIIIINAYTYCPFRLLWGRLQWLPGSLHVWGTRPELPPIKHSKDANAWIQGRSTDEIISQLQGGAVLSCPGTAVSCLSEEVDAVGDGVHGEGVSSDEEASKVDPRQVVKLGVEASQLPNVVADHVEQTFAHVLFGKF